MFCGDDLVRRNLRRTTDLECILMNRQIEKVLFAYDVMNAVVCEGMNKRAAPECIRECEYTGCPKQVRLRWKIQHKSRTE